MFVCNCIILLLALFHTYCAVAFRDYSSSNITKIVMLGMMTPMPYPDWRAPFVTLAVNNQSYIFDAGEGGCLITFNTNF